MFEELKPDLQIYSCVEECYWIRSCPRYERNAASEYFSFLWKINHIRVIILFSGANSSLLVKPVCWLSSFLASSGSFLLLGLKRDRLRPSLITWHRPMVTFLVTAVVPRIDLNGKSELSPSNIEVNMCHQCHILQGNSQPLAWNSIPPIRTIARKTELRAGQREADKREARSSLWNPKQVYGMIAICMCLCHN